MASSSKAATSQTIDEVVEGVSAWNKNMRWLIPFVQATGFRVVIENPKSHEKIVIDKDTKEFPRLSAAWLKRYDKNELSEWMAKEKEKESARRIAEAEGRKRFGDSYTVDEQDK
jgi:phosphoserine phosphatase